MKTDKFTEDMDKAFNWITALPSDDAIIGMLAMSFMLSKGAVNESSAVSEDEMENFTAYVQRVIGELRYLSLMASGNITANFSDGEPRFGLTEQGKRSVESTRQ